MKKRIKKDDVVLVSGATVNSAGIKSIHRSLAKVIEVGKYDAFLMTLPSGKYNRPFRLPIARCQKINPQQENILDSITEPKMGDLVMSLTATFEKVEQKIGTIKEIIEKPGEQKRAILKHSTKEHIVNYDTLIILEE